MALRHSASFLQTFHTAQTQAQRTVASETDVPTDRMDTDPAALAFVKGQRMATVSAPTDGSYECEINGHKVRCGGAYVSEKQAKWIIDIATTRETPGPAEAVLVRLEQGFAKFAGSQFITTYKDLPKKSVDSGKMAAVEYPANTERRAEDVPAGRYALRGEDGVVKFYRLDRPTQGRWAGYTFLKAQASDDLWPVKNPIEKARILGTIAKDISGAERLYGQKLGKCSRCGRTLTDETSRDYGMGPECRNK